MFQTLAFFAAFEWLKIDGSFCEGILLYGAKIPTSDIECLSWITLPSELLGL